MISRAMIDRRAVAFASSIVLIGALDLLTPFPAFSLLIVPLVLSAYLAKPWLTGVLTLEALLTVVLLVLLLGYPVVEYAPRASVVALAGASAAGLAEVLRRSRHRSDQDRRMLLRSEAHYRELAEESADVVVSSDAAGVIEYVSPAVHGVLGYEPSELEGRSMRTLVHPDDVLRVSQAADQMRAQDTVGRVRARLRRSDGSYRWCESTARYLRDDEGDIIGGVATWRDVEDAHRRQEEAETAARVDSLTGLLNRRGFDEMLCGLVAGTQEPDAASAVVFIDVDSFKAINDTYGHAVADEVLVGIARRVSGSIRGQDTVARIGGDEFVIVLRGIHRRTAAQEVADKIVASLAQPFATTAGPVWASVSVGVSQIVDDTSLEQAVRAADLAMYEAKRRAARGDAPDDPLQQPVP